MTPEERARAALDGWEAGMCEPPTAGQVAAVARAIREAAAEEREACARLAASWRESPRTQGDATGCMAAYDEGLDCAAPEGVAAAIRARKDD